MQWIAFLFQKYNSGYPVLLGLILGCFFPYFALSFSSYTPHLLFILMLSANLQLKNVGLKFSREELKATLLTQFICFIFLPSIIWGFTKAIVSDFAIQYGFFWAALCPIAIIAPIFAGRSDQPCDFTFKNMTLSTILFPFVAPAISYVFYSNYTLNLLPFALDLFIISLVPPTITLALKGLNTYQFGRLNFIFRFLPMSNMFIIGTLSFILMGSAWLKINLYLLSAKEIISVCLVAIFFDFGVYFLSPLLLKSLVSEPLIRPIQVALSMKNVVIAGVILLFSLPKAASAALLILIVHSVFFNFLTPSKSS